MAEIVMSAVILLIGITPVIIIGIVQYRSKEPVGFWSGKKPPKKEQITDVKAYNRKHGIMWIMLGAGFILCFLCGLIWGGDVAAYLCIAEATGGLLAMMAYHEKLERMYRKKEEDK